MCFVEKVEQQSKSEIFQVHIFNNTYVSCPNRERDMGAQSTEP
jgi:hypothetical protein